MEKACENKIDRTHRILVYNEFDPTVIKKYTNKQTKK